MEQLTLLGTLVGLFMLGLQPLTLTLVCLWVWSHSMRGQPPERGLALLSALSLFDALIFPLWSLAGGLLPGSWPCRQTSDTLYHLSWCEGPVHTSLSWPNESSFSASAVQSSQDLRVFAHAAGLHASCSAVNTFRIKLFLSGSSTCE